MIHQLHNAAYYWYGHFLTLRESVTHHL